jgi:glutaredoxin
MYYFITRDTPRCVYCEMVKNLAKKAGLDYKELSLESMIEFMQENGLKTVPVVFKDAVSMENYIGGATEFQRHVYSV